MAEQEQSAGTPQAAEGQAQLPGTESAQPPAETAAGGAESGFDASQMQAEIADLKKALAKKDADEKAAADQRLADQQKWQQLAEQRKGELESLTDRWHSSLKQNALQSAATTAGLQSMDYLKLVDSGSIAIEDGRVSGATEAVEALKASHPNLFGEPRVNVQTPQVNPGSNSPSLDPSRALTSEQIRALSDDEFQTYFNAKHGKGPGSHI